MGLTQKLGTIPLAIFTDTSNNVGIGAAANASYKLQVTGTTNLTGALTGTDISLQSSNFDILKWQKTSGTASNVFSLSADSAGCYIQDVTNTKTLLYLAENTGAATFSSIVSATLPTSTNGDGFRVIASAASAGGSQPAYAWYDNSSVRKAYQYLNVGNGSLITNVNGSDILTISSTGAATFSANSTTVEINTSNRGINITGKDNYYPLQITAGSTTGQSYGPYIKAGSNSSDQSLVIDKVDGSKNYFTIRGDGNVGIGTTSPTELLHLYKSSGSVVISLQRATDYGYIINDGTYLSLASNAGTTGLKLLVHRAAPDSAMTITSGGNVVIGSSSTGKVLLSPSTNAPQIIAYGGTGSNTIGNSANIIINDSATAGNRDWAFQIDGSTQLATFYQNGSGWTKVGYQTTGGTWTNSDERRKENIELSNYGLNEVLQLIPKTFNFKNDERKIKDIGFIAQDVLPIIPDAVRADMDGEEEYFAMNYSNLIPVLVKAIQEQQVQIEELKQIVATK